MNKPSWRPEVDDNCQWPRCRKIGTVHYTKGATKWITLEDGVWLCDEHQHTMSYEFFPGPGTPVEIGEQVWLAKTEDWPREQVWVRDWISMNGRVLVLVSDSNDTPLDDCQEVDSEMIE